MKKIYPICVSAMLALTFCSCGGGEETPTRPARTTGETIAIPRPEITVSWTVTSESDQAAGEGTSPQADISLEESSAAEAVSCADITAEILANVSMSSMAEVGADRVSVYIDCDIPEGTDFSFFICGSGGFADEICVINTSGLDAAAFSEAVDRRIEVRMSDFEDYNPDEYDKLSQMFTKQTGDYFIYAVTGNNEECERIFDKFMSK